MNLKMRNLFISRQGILRFMESPFVFSACIGSLNLERVRRHRQGAAGILPAVLFPDCSAGKMPAALWGVHGKAHDFDAVHWDHEPTPNPGSTELTEVSQEGYVFTVAAGILPCRRAGHPARYVFSLLVA